MADRSSESPSGTEDEGFFPGYPSVVSFTQECFGKLVNATQKAHGLPKPGDDFEFYCSFPDFQDFCKSQGNRLLGNIGKLMKFEQVKCGWPSNLDDETSLETDDMLELLVEANDILLERIDSCLDEASGLSKNKKPVLPVSMQQGSPVVSSWNKANHDGSQLESDKLRFLHAKNILRPQLKFKEKPDNSNVPFVPIIKHKPNALKPLEEYKTFDTVAVDDQIDVPTALANFIHEQRMKKPGVENHEPNPHPYQFELEQFEPEAESMMIKEEQTYKPLDETSLIFVDTIEKLIKLISVLKGVKEFAVDLEHHSFRSFQGIVCLIQISTRDEDYLIDTLELRSDMPLLNEVFTNPKILKVLHGADMDIGWLQRDFGIYVVNMFDTGQATRVLQYPRFSLAFLLKKFCDVTANKQYQLADWRIRPLPAEMVLYAREDTHYLLYVYDRLRNELVTKGNAQNNLLESVYKRSKEVCLKVYEKPVFTIESYLNLYHRSKKALNRNQLEAFRLLYAWRDSTARLEDESYGYVMPNHMMFSIAEVLPKEPQGILACCNPVPSLVRQNINELHRFIVQARSLDPKFNGPTTASRSTAVTEHRQSDGMANTHVDGGSLSDEKHESVDTGIKCEPMTPFKNYPITGPAVCVAEPAVHLFSYHGEVKQPSEGEKRAAVIKESFKNPFQAFLPAKKTEDLARKSEQTPNKCEAALASGKSSMEINQQWKSKSEKAVRGDEGASRKADEAKKRKHDSNSEDDENTDEAVSLRQTKKNKKREKSSSKLNESKSSHDKEGDTTSEGTKQFVPFDYSSASLDFDGKSDVHRKQNKNIFNPYKKLTEKSKQFGSKVHMKSGERSMTFGKKK